MADQKCQHNAMAATEVLLYSFSANPTTVGLLKPICYSVGASLGFSINEIDVAVTAYANVF